MTDLTEIERRILSELQEAGEENVAAMLNTVVEPVDDAGQVDRLQQALERLVETDLVRIALQRDVSTGLQSLTREQSFAIVAGIRSNMQFLTKEGLWTWIQEPRPQIVVTEAGRARAEEILEQYGYQWWRHKK